MKKGRANKYDNHRRHEAQQWKEVNTLMDQIAELSQDLEDTKRQAELYRKALEAERQNRVMYQELYMNWKRNAWHARIVAAVAWIAVVIVSALAIVAYIN